VHHEPDTLDLDIESMIMKIYSYFSIYAVRTEQPKEYFEVVEVEYCQHYFITARHGGSRYFLVSNAPWRCFQHGSLSSRLKISHRLSSEISLKMTRVSFTIHVKNT